MCRFMLNVNVFAFSFVLGVWCCMPLLGQGRVKLADFGLVRSLDESDAAAQQGAAPGTTVFQH